MRYRYLTKYARLPPEEPREEPKMDFFVDSGSESNSKTGFSTYVEDFLSAIKIFGHLERPVFHELTRQMQTFKLEQGETLPLDEEKGFYIVVDGTIQVLTKQLEGPAETVGYSDRDTRVIDGNTYELLNEVPRGAPLSSLIALLSLFASTLKKEAPPAPTAFHRNEFQVADLGRPLTAESRSISNLELSKTEFEEEKPQLKPALHTQPAPKHPYFNSTVAVAAEDSTIAIIPQSAFLRLTKKFPKAAGHMVQVIMTRLSRVTFQTGHHYLGLTPEIYKSEITLNDRTTYELPSYLRESAVNGAKETIEKNPELEKQSFVYHSKQKGRHSQQSQANGLSLSRQKSRQIIIEPKKSHPGDLLSNVPLLRSESLKPGNVLPTTAAFTGDEETEDNVLRVAITECIFKIIGLDYPVKKEEILSNSVSLESTPLMTAVDSRADNVGRQSFNNVLNNLSKMERGSIISQQDDESIASSNSPKYESAQLEASQSLEVIYYKKGSVLIEQGGDSHGFFYVIDGFLEVGYRDKSQKHCKLYTIKPGGVGGFVGAALSYKSFVEVKAKTDVHVGFMPRSALERITEKYPSVLLSIADTLTNILSNLIFTLDLAIEWVQVPQGQVLFHQGDEADAIYIVLTGRLRSVIKQGSKSVKRGEYGQGDSIGELEVLTVSKRAYTVHAIRESELAKVPRALFESLAKKHPSITIEIARIIASRVSTRLGAPSLSGYEAPPVSSFRTVSIVPITSGLPVQEFGQKLMNAYKDIGQNVTSLNIAAVLHHLGRNAFNKIGLLKLSGHLADLEEKYQTVVYIADTHVNSLWTQTCIAQADCILLVASAAAEPEIGEYERLLVTMKTTARTELILLHDERYVSPGSTSKWLKNRIWVHSHHHIQMPFSSQETHHVPYAANDRLSRLKNKVQSIQSDLVSKYKRKRVPVYTHSYVHKDDFYRLARILSGTAVGLVLGGGGARGLSHIGIIRALEERGIPIDFVGGTSIGAFVGGLYAKEYDLVPIFGRAKKFAYRISSLWRMVFDLTYPATSYTTGHEFNRGIWKTFGDTHIEDFWLKYYTNTTNITHSKMEIHKSGYAWRYIRASMSLAGLLPPITDKGSMLLDGGYVDNLPVAEMKAQGAKYIFAVDVGSIDDTTPMKYGDTLSGIWVLFNRWNIFSKHPNVPNLAEIQARLAYVSSVGALEKAKATPGVIYVRPPIDNYATLDFGKFDEIYEVGNKFAHELLDKLKKEDKFPSIPGATPLKGATQKPSLVRRNSV